MCSEQDFDLGQFWNLSSSFFRKSEMWRATASNDRLFLLWSCRRLFHRIIGGGVLDSEKLHSPTAQTCTERNFLRVQVVLSNKTTLLFFSYWLDVPCADAQNRAPKLSVALSIVKWSRGTTRWHYQKTNEVRSPKFHCLFKSAQKILFVWLFYAN